MKYIFILSLIGMMQVNATVHAQHITLSIQNGTVRQVLKEIENQCDMVFMYDYSRMNLNKLISIKANNEPLEAVLKRITQETDLSYEIVGRQIVLSPKPIVTPDKTGIMQQGIRIVGTVFDNNGELLPGVSVVIRGTTTGINTDANGEFNITVPDDTSVLIFSYIGYKPQEVTVGAKRILVVIMQEDVAELEEVVVVAFGKQRKESVVSSITTVRTGDLKVPSSNLTTALTGRIAGLISYQRSGEPGQDNADFFVRGITSFGTGKVNPLILIDGVELSTEDLSRLNTDDIASFSVMKDANATALYGARGANGVILVTTKEGSEGKARFSVRFENSLSAPTKEVELADPITYMLLGNEAVRTRDPLGVIPYSNEKIANTGRGNPYVYPATDWRKLMFKDYTMNQRLNMNISGGGKIARYYVAASFNKDNGILNVDKRNNFNNNIDLRKYLLRSNVNINVTPTTELIVRLHGTFDDYTGPLDGGTGVYNKVMRTNPVLFPAYFPIDKAHEYTQHILFGNTTGANYINPYADMVRGYRDASTTLVLAQLELKQDLGFLLKGLSARGLFNTTRYSYFDVSRYYNPFYYRIGSYDKYTDIYKLTELNPTGGTEYLNYSEGQKDVSSTVYFEAAVQYDNTFADDHTVSSLLVFTGREELRGNAGDLQLSLPYRNLGLSGRLTYSFKNTYFIEGNFGYNGSERFDKNHRWGFFPSIGAGYLISNETFWEQLQQTVSKLKLKATYGLVGNDAIGSDRDRFFYLSNVNLNDGGRGMSFGSEWSYYRSGVSFSRYEDPNITWETAYKQNYGIEIGLFDKIEILADYFRENRTSILQSRASIPSTMGLQATPQSNIGEAFASGVDMSVDYTQSFASDFWLAARGNFTYATSEYRVYEEPDYSLTTPWRSHVGQKLSQQWGLIAERLFIDEADVSNSPRQAYGEYMAGDIKYKDINMDGLIDDRDRVPIGYPTTPEIIYGFGFSLGYKHLDLSAFFQGSTYSSFWIDVPSVTPFANTTDGVISQNALMKVIADNHWSEDYRNPRAFWPRLSSRVVDNNAQRNTWFMCDGTFFRLKTAELGYTLPPSLTRKIRIEVMRFYLSGTNLWTLSKFKLWDPEMAGNGLGYPVQRVVNIGLNISL